MTAGFSFKLLPYYSATIESASVWVNKVVSDDPSKNYVSTVTLIDEANPTQPIVSMQVAKSSCTLDSSTGFCTTSLPPSAFKTISDSNATYRLTATYNTSIVPGLNSDNLYVISDLSSAQVSYLPGTTAVTPYDSGTCTGSVCNAQGLFGPNLKVTTTYDAPPVPGAAPILGAMAAFHKSRRLRRRIQST